MDRQEQTPTDALSTVIRTGLFFTDSILNKFQQGQIRARDFANSLDTTSVTTKMQGIRSYSFGSVSQYKQDALNVPGITPFTLPTRDNCTLSPATRRRMLMKDFGSINPALYQSMDSDDNMTFPEGHVGRLWFQLAYERDSEKLICTIVKAKNLSCRPDKSLCDPFVRICLLPDERRTLQTKVRRKTCDPRFDEAFVFPVSTKTITERVIRFSVYDIDRRKKHVLIGHACYSLDDFDVNIEKRPTMWRDLNKEGKEVPCNPARGELLISLCYNSDMQRLTVNILEGKNLQAKEKPTGSEACVKVSLMHQSKLVKRQKTQSVVCRSELEGNTSFYESFHFKMPTKMGEAVSLIIVAEVLINKPFKEKRTIGRIILGGMMFARGKELEHWQECMQRDKEHIQEWHTLAQF